MKSALQERAEAVAGRFNGARKPIIIEFAGVPRAGQTSTLGQIQAFLMRCGFRVEVVIERASVCPIRDKKHANFNIWTACTTLSQILENPQTPFVVGFSPISHSSYTVSRINSASLPLGNVGPRSQRWIMKLAVRRRLQNS